jgi:gelsolin
MAKVLWVQGKEMKEIKPPYKFFNGDVYVIDDSRKPDGKKKDLSEKPKVYIWLGSKAFADDRGVGAWAAKQLDIENQDIDIDTEVEGQESAEFKKVINFQVVEGDTPGFLKHVEVNFQDIDFEMYQVRDTDISDGSSTDDIEISPVPIARSSLSSDDVYVIDGWHSIYVWIGSKSQVGEKAAGNRLARKLDTERRRNPLVYVVNEGVEPKGFFEFIERLAKEDPRKSSGKKKIDPGKDKITQTDNLAKRQMLNSLKSKDSLQQTTAMKKSQEMKKSEESRKKGIFGKLFGKK